MLPVEDIDHDRQCKIVHKKGSFSMSAEQNKMLLRTLYGDIFSKGDTALIEQTFAEDYVNHDVSGPPGGWPHGRMGFYAVTAAYRGAFPDLQFTIEEQIAEGDRVATRWVASGTNTGSLAGMPPTGKSVAVGGISIERIVNGQVAETWVNFDQLGMLQQLGVIPTPGS
jgi:steroid delta-isomerase-like uncharacterized protein